MLSLPVPFLLFLRLRDASPARNELSSFLGLHGGRVLELSLPTFGRTHIAASALIAEGLHAIIWNISNWLTTVGVGKELCERCS